MVSPVKPGTPTYYSYYNDIKPEDRDALRASLLKTFQALPVGVFHRWDTVLDHSCFAEHNPLTRGQDPAKLSITVDRRQYARIPEMVELAGKTVLDIFLTLRLLPLDAVRAAIDAEGNSASPGSLASTATLAVPTRWTMPKRWRRPESSSSPTSAFW